MKIIDLNQSIHTLVTSYPEVKDILFNLGFTEITKPGMLQTVGRIMTPIKGSQAKGISLEIIKEAFIKQGFNIKES